MQYKKLSQEHTSLFAEIVGEDHVLSAYEQMRHYAHDHTEDLEFMPELVLKPNTTDQVSAILKICNREGIPLTVRGAGTGLSGGALPLKGGLLLSMERFNKILQIDERNFQATVEPGVINEVFQQAVAAKGLFYPPDPASKGSCFLGGNLAHSSGGPRALKYGTTRDYVLNMEIVLADGSVIWTGANTLKYSTGYNLTHLMIGSEGTLAVITKIVFRLIPKPQYDLLMLVPFQNPELACEAVGALFRAGFNPSACEFIEREGFRLSSAMLSIPFDLPEIIESYLLIEVDGNNLEQMMSTCEQMAELLATFSQAEILFADTAEQKEKIWKLRRAIGEAVKTRSVYKEEDTVVPRAELPMLMRGLKEISGKYGLKTVSYGHAGDGNLHINILREELDEHAWNSIIHEAIREIFRLCVQLGGTISGEHGIGYVQKNFMDIALSQKHFELMHGIKAVFDPNFILNPGKILPDSFMQQKAT